ncbi:cation:proton antiporter [Oerskovia enterophila]|uniref:Sodium, potassium, lithium and rubidium/H(+) antiporter n=1 Tax=Oerskovia enterophila TaxID=43678 RepID=A0A163SGW0_9CELL|nr:sodium:proton antiporter [Oerskovia enterophila]KZM36411.1 sodium, potassium, lithium and rubidium/H(+) antiporter [Oerskovia enterophila]
MEFAPYLIAGVLAVVGVTALAPRLGVAAPLILVLLGVAVSFLPAVSAVEVDPEWILAGVLPPLLYSASVSMPAMDFRRDLKAISGLSVVLVVISAVVLGFLFHLLIPGIGLATGIALGAIISPTDAVATSIVKKAGVSPRVVTVLEGESLLNDASALVLLRSAIAATAATVSVGQVAGAFVYAVAVAVAIGFVVGKANLWLRSRVREATSNTAISFVVPFIAFLPSEHLGASGLVAVVTAGIVTGLGAPKHLSPQDRIAEKANWRTVELLLESGVFLLMGLEVFGLVEEVREEHGSLWTAAGLALMAAVVVIALRSVFVAVLLWLMKRSNRRNPEVREKLSAVTEKLERGELPTIEDREHGTGRRKRRARRGPGGPGGAGVPGLGGPGGLAGARGGPGAEPFAADDPRFQSRMARVQTFLTRRIADIDYLAQEPLGRREGVLLVWAGMRGVVTLAAAQSLPADTPHRALLILIAFFVAAGTLLVQGGTLPWVVRRLDLTVDTSTESDERLALLGELSRVASEVIDAPGLVRPDGTPYAPETIERVRQEIAHDDLVDREATEADEQHRQYRELRLAVLAAQREELLHVRDHGTYSSGAMDETLKVLDASQISVEMHAPAAER